VQIPRSVSVAALALTLLGAGVGAAQAAAPGSAPGSASSGSTAPATGPRVTSHPRPDAVTVPAHTLTHFSHLLHPGGRTANQTSTNWSGYATQNGTFTTVSSSWIEPSVSCTSSGIVAFWIGLDGWGSQTVEQDGTGVDCSSGSPQYFAWWETYPANAIQQYSDPVSPGDQLSSTVTAQGGGQYNMVLTDSTQGWTETNPVSASGSNASAEIIAEAVTSGSSVTPLPNFGQVTFTGNSIDNQSLSAAGAQAIDMTNGQGGPVIAKTGPLDGSGDFSVYFGSSVPGGNTVTVNSPGNQTGTVGGSANLQITGSDSGGASLSYSATGLPPGTSISGSGLISGTFSASGTYDVTVTAKDSTGATGTASFTWTVNGGGGDVVTVTNPGAQTSTVGGAVSLQIHATDSASGQTLSYSASGLPAGLSINARSGLISGTPSTAGGSTVTVTVRDGTGATGTTSFGWTVTGSGGGCGGLAAWSSGTAYAPGDQVSYGGHKWTSLWYSTGVQPGSPVAWDIWQDDGAC
jgi:hypothetical protein